MPILSSDTLFHFTTWDNLIGILENEFYPKFSLEKFSFKNNISNISAVPMISFCDIPLSQIKLHVNRYGSYGIGLKKEWGITKGINPVLYIEKNSNLSSDIYNLFINIIRKNKEESGEQKKQYDEIDAKISELEKNPSI
jgi:hypothetical protein